MPGENIQDWSVTAANNATADSSINWAEGQARASVNDSARSMMAAVAKDRNLKNGSITTGGTANAQTFSSGLSYTSVPTGLRASLKIGTSLTNTDTATLNMDGIGAVTIKNQFGDTLGPGELRAGAYADFLYDGTNWRLRNHPGGVVLVAQTEASASSSVDFSLHSAYTGYKLIISNLTMSVDETVLELLLSTNGGSSFVSAGYFQEYILHFGSSGTGAATSSSATSAAFISCTSGVDNSNSRAAGIEIDFYGPAGASNGLCAGKAVWYNDTSASGTQLAFFYWTACCPGIGGINAIRLVPGSGNISGTFSLYGYL